MHVTGLDWHCHALVTEDAEDSLSVDHLADDADRSNGLYLWRTTVNSCKEPELRVSHEPTLEMNVCPERSLLDGAARLYDHVAN